MTCAGERTLITMPAPPALGNSPPQVVHFPAIIRFLQCSAREKLSPSWTSKEGPLGQAVIIGDHAIMLHNNNKIHEQSFLKAFYFRFLEFPPGLPVYCRHGLCSGLNMQDPALSFKIPHHLSVYHSITHSTHLY